MSGEKSGGAICWNSTARQEIFASKRKHSCVKTLTAYVEWDPATKLYVGTIPGIPGAHTQAKSLDELNHNLKEVLELCFQEYPKLRKELPRFIGLQQIEVA